MSSRSPQNEKTKQEVSSRQLQIKEIALLVRALVTSRQQPCFLNDILRDYQEIDGKPIDYRYFGHRTIVDFLNETGEFDLNRFGREKWIIIPKHSAKSAHISAMIRQQKKSKPSRVTPLPSRPPRRSDQSWNKSSYSSNVYQRLLPPRKPSYRFNIPQKTSYIPPQKQQQQQVFKQQELLEKQKQKEEQLQKEKQTEDQLQKQKEQERQQQQLQRQRSQQQTRTEQKDLRILLDAKYSQSENQPKMSSRENNSGKLRVDLNQRLRQQQSLPMAMQPSTLGIKYHQQLSCPEQQQHQQQQQIHYNPEPLTTQNPIRNLNGPRAILGQNNNSSSLKNNQISINEISQNTIQQQQFMQKNHEITMILNQNKQQQQQQQLQAQEKLASDQRVQQRQSLLKEQQKSAFTLPPVPPRQGAISVQNRLKILPPISNNDGNNNNNNDTNNARVTNLSLTMTIPVTSPPPPANDDFNVGNEDINSIASFVGQTKYFKSYDYQPVANTKKLFQLNKDDPIRSLVEFCLVRNYKEPEYIVYRSNFNKSYLCRVSINGSVYSTYPEEYKTEVAAKIASARQAVEQIQEQESRRDLPQCTDSDDDLEMKIYEEVQSHRHGIFSKNIPELFEKRFKQTLPDHWWSVVQNSKRLMYEIVNDNIIIREQPAMETTIITKQIPKSVTTDDASSIIKLPNIQLPWNEKYWNLCITHCVSTIEIWGRLFGKDYSEQFDNVMNEIDVHMLTEKVRPISVIYQQIYLFCLSECWHRVQLQEVDLSKGVGLCFFIDFGEEDWLPINELYVCDHKFLKLPAQSVVFSLFGLEDFAENPNAKRHLDKQLVTKSVVAEILTKEEAYKVNAASNVGNSLNRIQAVLWDTSSTEDINLNPLILNSICDDTQPPEIKREGTTNVIITYISDLGDLYVQVENPELQYVQNLIHQLIESKFKKDQHKVNENDMRRSNMFLICDDDDDDENIIDEKFRLSSFSSTSSSSTISETTSHWYRGTLLTNPGPSNNVNYYDIFFIDYGHTKRIHISKIFRLESLSTALSKFPWQAIKTKLHDIPTITKEIVGRIRALLPFNLKAWAKMGIASTTPSIIIYKRFEGNQTICNVNEALRIEHELQSFSDLLKNDEISPNNEMMTQANGRNQSPPRKSSMPELNQSIRNLSMNSSLPESSEEELTRLSAFAKIPTIGEYFRVRVVMASNPVNFTVQPYDEYPQLVALMKDLQKYCETCDEYIPPEMVKIGEAYAAKNSDGFYYRAIVVTIIDCPELIHVYFCDFGHVEIVSSDKLKNLPSELRKLPKQALQAKLYGIAAFNGDWSFDDCCAFRKLTVGKNFVSVIRGISTDPVSPPDTKILELDLIDVETQNDIYIGRVLISEGRAIDISKAKQQ